MKRITNLIVIFAIMIAYNSKDVFAGANMGAMNIESENVIETEAKTNNKADVTKMIEDIQASQANVEDDYAAWLHQVAIPNLQNKCARKGIDLSLPECTHNALFYGDGAVMLSPEHPNWVDARSLAYDKALIKAYQKAAEYLSLNNETKMVQELFQDSQKPTFEDELKSNLDVLIDKTIALAEGKLDSQLTEMGIDPAKFNAASKSVRKTMLKDAISKQSVKSAIASTTGMIPYQTFEGKDANGNHIIRVVVSTEPDRIDLVKTMLSKREKVMPNTDKKSSKSLYERLVLDKSILVNQFGTRLMYDEYGYPVLVAFGQAGVEKAATHSGIAARAEIAQRKAVSHADAVLTLLLNSTTSSKEMTKEILQHLEEEKLISDQASASISEELSETDAYDSYIDSKTTVSGRIQNFAGRSEFYNWSYELPKTKHKVTGVILMWSPQTARHAQDIKSGKTSSAVRTNNVSENKLPSKVIRGIESDF